MWSNSRNIAVEQSSDEIAKDHKTVTDTAIFKFVTHFHESRKKRKRITNQFTSNFLLQ